MLGAQARAAELQAAKSAAMRQRAHREAAELSYPPESAAASLTDFARNRSLNKNKGPKAFRPLTESDFEVMENQSDTQDPASEGPPVGNVRKSGLESAPIAPRAMLNRSDSQLSKLTPSRVQAPVFTPRSQTTESFVKSSDSFGGKRLTPGISPCTDKAIVGSKSRSPYVVIPQNTVAYVYGPDDLSPSKQEIKFAEMREQYDMIHNAQGLAHHHPTPFIPEPRTFTSQQSTLR